MITVHGSGRSHGRAAGGTGAVVAEGDEAGRPPDRSRRRLIDGIRLQVRTGVPRRDVPVEYGPWGRAHDLFRCAANTVMGGRRRPGLRRGSRCWPRCGRRYCARSRSGRREGSGEGPCGPGLCCRRRSRPRSGRWWSKWRIWPPIPRT
ncbi:transposase [Streptomyces sp. NPDC060334]|uniref:transposase n=1 Tax=Streptomyces sp. NPDC060334 TaxID=3347099 RepID=UPI0036581231